MKTHLTCLLVAAVLLLGSILPATAADQTATWNNTTGNWSDPTKWSTNPLFPNNGNGGFTFDAIQNGGTVTVDQAITIEKYNFTAGTNTGAGFALTTNDLLTWTGGVFNGNFNGTGTINANGGATLSGGLKTMQNSRVLSLSGASTWSSGEFDLQNTSSLVNTASGTLTSTLSGFNVIQGGGTFTNAGTFTQASGNGYTALRVSFSNTGTVNVNSGTLAFESPITNTGALVVGTGAVLNFAGPGNLNAGTSVSGAGTVQFDNSSSTNFNAGTYNVTGTTSVNSVNTTPQFNAPASTGSLNLASGAFGGLSVSSTLSLGDGSTARNSTWSSGNFTLTNGGTLTNTVGSTLTTTFGSTLSASGTGTKTFNNEGTFTKSGAVSTTTINPVLNNTGTVNANSGTLNLNGGVTQHSGATLNGGTWNVTGGSTLNINTGSNITTLGTGASVTLSGAGSAFTKITTALNNNQGSFTLANNRDLTTAGAFTNSGTMTVQDSTTVMTVNGSYTQTAGSTILSNGGTIMLSTNLNLNGGELKGSGTITGNVITGGTTTIAPGESPGTLTINGNLTLGSGNTLAMEIGGLTQGSLYDYLDVNGVTTLAGILDVNLDSIFGGTLTGGETFTLLTSNSTLTGSFSNVANGSRLNVLGGSFQVNYGGNDVVLGDYLSSSPVPEPSRALLIILGLGGVMLRRKRATSIHSV